MEESKRQKQVAKLVMEEISDIFQREGVSIIDGGMVSIAKVLVTPDLLEARIYLSLFQVKDPEALMKKIKEQSWDYRKQLGELVRNQLRRIPELYYYIDDSLDHAFKMDAIFRKIQEERDAREKSAQ